MQALVNMFRKMSKSAPARKSKAAAMRLPRFVRRCTANVADYAKRPPVIVNSLPKSGTHLLMQVALALPGYSTYGTFIATTPSVTMRRRRDEALARRIMQLAPGEVCGAHLYYSEEARSAIEQRGAISIFIYRDPREVFWSEMQYLLTMNRWHRAGRAARRIADPDRRFDFFLHGLAGRPRFDWPRFRHRVEPYLGWLDDANTFCCRYEEFRSADGANAALRRLALYIASRSGMAARHDVEGLVSRFREAIRPEASHTFRSGRSDEWRMGLSASQVEALEREVAGLARIFAE